LEEISMRKMMILACLALLASTSAWAGHGHEGKMDAAKMHEAMKAEMAKCMVCKNMAPHLDALGPVMKMEAVKLNDGMAITHSVTDPAKVTLYHTAWDAMHQAGDECMKLTDEQAKTQLCGFCQEVRSVAKAGATISAGKSKNGDVMVIRAADAPTQAQIASIHEKCVTMMAAMEPQAAK
jgi:hypothetical protein